MASTTGAPPTTTVEAQDSTPRRWLALGDSFSSGEGIPGASVGNPELQGREDCQRANGDGTNAKAHAVVAAERLAASGGEVTVESPFFVACTGAITDDIDRQLDEMRAAVPEQLQRWDIVSLTLGGNNLGFERVIEDCTDIKDLWGTIVFEGCSANDEQLRRRVDMLVGRTPIDPDEYLGLRTLPEVYDEVAGAVEPGGHVLVLGYPQLLEEPDLWASWLVRNTAAGCQGVLRSDVRMLRGVTGYLNEQTALAVQAASDRWAASDVTFHFIDVATRVYEISNSPQDRHGLCAAEQWINGLTTGWTSGDAQHERSFHPTQEGHTATGWLLADEVVPSLRFDAPPPSGFVLPAVCSLPETEWTTNEHPDTQDPGPWAYGVRVDGDVTGNGVDDTVWATACGEGTVATEREVHVFGDQQRFLGTLPVEELVGEVYEDLEVHAVEPRIADGVVVVEVWVWQRDDMTCCPSIAFPLSFAWNGNSFDMRSPIPPPEAPIALTADAAIDRLNQYLLAAGARNYSDAWAMLASDYQAKYGGRGAFESFWNGISLVGTTNIEPQRRDDGTMLLEVTIWFDVIGRGRETELVEVDVGIVEGQTLITDYRYVRTLESTATGPPDGGSEASYPPAECIASEVLHFGMEGQRGEIARYQLTLKNAGYDPGDIDGYFGEMTLQAASSEIQDNGPDDLYDEYWPDGGEVNRNAFIRLGIAC